MIGALLRYVLLRRLPLFVGSVVVTVLVIGSGALWPFELWALFWGAVLMGGVLLAARFDLGDGAE